MKRYFSQTHMEQSFYISSRVIQLVFHMCITCLVCPSYGAKQILSVLNIKTKGTENVDVKEYSLECEKQNDLLVNTDWYSTGLPKPTILVFNHPNCIDPFILMCHLNPFPRFVTSQAYIPFFLYPHAMRMGALLLPKLRNTKRSVQMYYRLFQMMVNKEQGLMAVAPTGGDVYPSVLCQKDLPSFHSGAFIKSHPILPVVVHYSPFWCFQEKETSVQFLWRLVTRYPYDPIEYILRVLPVMKPTQDNEGLTESITSYMSRVKNTMEMSLSSF